MDTPKTHTCDFSRESPLSGWKIIAGTEMRPECECRFESEEGDFILLWDHRNFWEPFPEFLSVNGIPADSCDDYYLRPGGSRYGLPVHCRKGENTIRAEVRLEGKTPDDLKMTLVPAPPPVSAAAPYSEPYSAGKAETWTELPSLSREGFTPGAGRERIPGRFASMKGDGLLDCAITKPGVIDKMYLCSHPKYRKPHRWLYSTRPEQGITGEEKVDVRGHLSTTWSVGSFSCTCSLASPGIITESGTADSRLSKLEFAGSYRYILTSDRICSIEKLYCSH